MLPDIVPENIYRIEVIPRSNVERAANGTPLSLEGGSLRVFIIIHYKNNLNLLCSTEKFIEYQVLQIHFIELSADNMTAIVELTPNMTVS